MNEVLTIRAHARQSVDQLDLHGIPAEPPQGLDGEALKQWELAFFSYCVEKEKQTA